jgi:hypothetical protein
MKRKWHSPTYNQPELFAILWLPPQHPFRLRVGDVFRQGNRVCRVVRINDCSAVIVRNQKAREFETRFRGPVRFQPSPTTFRISPKVSVEILNHKKP